MSDYIPQVDDYVVWNQGEHGVDEGWVYFVGPKIEKKDGFRENARYITIETGVKPKPECRYTRNEQHKNIHTLLLCYEHQWKDLKCTKNRRQ